MNIEIVRVLLDPLRGYTQNIILYKTFDDSQQSRVLSGLNCPRCNTQQALLFASVPYFQGLGSMRY